MQFNSLSCIVVMPLRVQCRECLCAGAAAGLKPASSQLAEGSPAAAHIDKLSSLFSSFF